MTLRAFWVIVHRWAGLTIALFLAVAGITGTLLAFYDELEVLSAPRLHRAPAPYAGAPMLAPQDLRERIIARHPGGTIDYMPLHFAENRGVIVSVSRVDPATGARSEWSPEWDELFVSPYTGETLGHRRLNDLRQGWVNLMPFIYQLHHSFALGECGLLAFGIAALIWTLDCFVGLYLTFPLRRKNGTPPKPAFNWWQRWRPAWLVRWKAGQHKLTFDLHRAGGLWIWPILLIFAWSGVYFNLTPVYRPVMGLFGYTSVEEGIVPPPQPRYTPRLDFRAAEIVGRNLAETELHRRGLTLDPTRETGLLHIPAAGIYSYIFSSSVDMRRQGGRSLVLFDSDSGKLIKLVLPQKQNAAITFTEWLSALHMAAVWGLPWRLAVAAIGLMVTMLSVTGVMLWARKRSARLLGRKKTANTPSSIQGH